MMINYNGSYGVSLDADCVSDFSRLMMVAGFVNGWVLDKDLPAILDFDRKLLGDLYNHPRLKSKVKPV